MPVGANRDLRKLAKAALAEFGWFSTRLTHLTSRHNEVFRVDAGHGQRFVLRIQDDSITDAQAEAQLKWLEALATQSEVVVPAPVRTSDGRAYTSIEMNGTSRRAVLLRWLPGQLARTRDDDVYRAAVCMVALLHDHAEVFRPAGRFFCRALDGDFLFGPRFFVRNPKFKAFRERWYRKTAAAAERLVRGAMDGLGRRRRRFGVIHADLNLSNIVFHKGRPSPIDFDEFGKGWYLFDLAELMRTSIKPDNWTQRKRLAIDAYRMSRPLDEAELDAFDAFIVASTVQYLNWAFGHARDEEDLKWVNFSLSVIRQII